MKNSVEADQCVCPETKGILYVVATPIGNLEDITLRAIRILKEADFILCEDKRQTVKLLNKYEIKSKLISFHKFNEEKIQNEVLSLLNSGKSLALVSDAGTPLISDPGSKLVLACHENKIKVISIPGSSSLTGALSVSGLDLKEFLFVGFLPGKKSKRKRLIASFNERSKNVVLFVGPHDFKKYINEIYEIFSDINVFYGRELTKIHEESWFGNIKELISNLNEFKAKGEIIFCLQIV